MYEKRPIVNFPFISSNIPTSPGQLKVFIKGYSIQYICKAVKMLYWEILMHKK